MFKIVWDKEYNGVRLTMSSAGEALNIAPRPVFSEELDLLGMGKYGWKYPRTEAPLLWACERRYFYKGELVMEVKGGNIFDSPTITISDNAKGLHLEPVDMERLRARNEDTMFILEHEAMNFINDTYRKYKGIAEAAKKNPEDVDFLQLAAITSKEAKEEHVVIKESCDSFDIMPLSEAERLGRSPILSTKIEMFVATFSGGKDSQVVLDLVSRVIPADDFIVVYSDTGYELPTSLALYKEVEKFYHEQYPELKFYVAKNEQPLLYYWDNIGAPSRIHRWCCSVMKSAPLARLLKDIHGTGKQPKVMLFDGVRAEESEARSGRAKIGKNVKHNNEINVSPILEWNSVEIYLYLFFHGLPINKSYRSGLARVGCVICPYSSGWSEDLCGRLYPETLAPFVDRIRCNLKEAKVSGIDNYIRLGKWKTRAGGRNMGCESNMRISNVAPDFQAVLSAPRENILMWMRVLGDVRLSAVKNGFSGELKHQHHIYKFSIIDEGSNQVLQIFGIDPKDVVFIGHLKRVVYKATYCVHCEVCEVECPTGALSVVPKVSVNSSKCIHCLKCLDFHDKGCVSAASVTTSDVNLLISQNNMDSSKKSGINRYNDGMGLREKWLRTYFETHQTFFDNEEHGLNPRYQIPPFINWLREACILKMEDKTITEIGLHMANKYNFEAIKIWEIIFINLCENSEICNWFYSHIGYDRSYTKEEMDVILQDSYPDLRDRTLSNPFNSLLNTFKESPLGSEIPVGVLEKKQGKLSLTRMPHIDVSLLAVAYSMFKYSERIGRKSLTVSEFYSDAQQSGIYHEFGISKDTLERKLRSIQEESNHVLTVELNMGLDNIILREDLTSADVLKLML